MKWVGAVLIAGALVTTGCAQEPAREPAPAPADAPERAEVNADGVERAAAPALTDERVLELGRRYVEHLYEEDVEALWDAFDQDMREGLGSADQFAATIEQMSAQLGVPTTVEDESVLDPGQDDVRVYRRITGFSNVAESVQITIAFRPDERIGGLFLRPVQP